MRLSWRVINMLVVFAVLTAVDIFMYGPGGKTGWDIPGILLLVILILIYEYKSDH